MPQNRSFNLNVAEYLNFAEATISLRRLSDNKLLVATKNLNVMEGNTASLLKNKEGEFLGFAYVTFEGVFGCTEDYEASRQLNPEKRTCIGGDLFSGNRYLELWFEYSGSGLQLIDNNSIDEQTFFDFGFYSGT